jgi:hypothetical protein
MLKALRPRLTFANVMVVVLTFVVLGGGAYAAFKLPKNSVGTKQLKKGAVTKVKISKATLRQLQGATGPAGAPASAGGVLPAGITLRGTAATAAGAGGSTLNWSSRTGVSFAGFQLPSRPIVRVVGLGGSAPPECTGTIGAPQASPGYLCLYVSKISPGGIGTFSVLDPTVTAGEDNGVRYDVEKSTSEQLGDGRVSTVGFVLWRTVSVTDGVIVQATWAVTT